MYPIKDFQQTITDFGSIPLDPKTEQRVTDEIEKWEKHDKDLELLKADFEVLKETVEDLKTKDERRHEHKRKGNIFKRFSEWISYRKMKKELQGDLIKFYRNRCSSIPLSPLVEEVETPLAGFYVMPDLVAIKQSKSFSSDVEEKTPVKSLRDLFSVGSGNQREMYLSADAGFGKTAFSKYLTVTWCQAHHQDKNYYFFKDEELKALSDFEFLFLVLLRDCSDICSIDKMIEQQIIEQLPTSVSLEDILRKETCLIILDGLDEWIHPENGCSRRNEKIPHRYVREKCVILTTTRPWKFGVSNLTTSQINKIEMVQLSEDSTRQLEKNAISKMTGIPDGDVLTSKIRDLNKVILDCDLQHMQKIPLLLMFITCLWCNGIPIGNSKCDVYTHIIEFLLSRTAKKHPEIQPSCDYSACDVPEYFRNQSFIKKFISLIKSLSELAYQTLFNKTKENTLVFDRSVAETYLKADDIKISLFSGILSESRTKTLIKEITKVSFCHKTVQEFFAAIFISSHSDVQKIVLERCKNVQDIMDMSILYEFTSKIDADQMCAISNDLMSVINELEKTRDYRTRTGRENLSNNPLYDIQKMFMSFLQEMPESENIHLCLQDFFIDYDTEDSKQLQRLLKQNKTNIKSLYIDISLSLNSLSEITHVDSFSLTDLSHIQKLYYSGDKTKEAEINRILFPSLQYVSLWRGNWTNDEQNLSENLAQLQNLQYLYIWDFTLSHKILETFFNFISDQKSMKELTLNELHCKEHGRNKCKGLNLDFSQHSTLSKLHLRQLPRLQLNTSTPSLVDVRLYDIQSD
ncbi:uncharacterized protein LOC132717898 isoform X2 [Ruditapes philippinarum]|nr:uncharacterized protein LOC132717898 isoform X2 [Ruditapes philippinarum]